MLNQIDFFVIAIYLGLLIGLGFFISLRKQHSTDLFLAGRNLKWPTIGLSIFGTNISPMMMISSAGVAYAYGMVANNFEWLAWIFLLIFAFIFLPFYLKTKIVTMPQFIEMRYNKSTRNILSWFMVLQIVIGIGSVLYAGGLLLSQIVGWPLWVCIIVVATISASFTITGGLEAVTVTDSFQAIFMILACSAMVWVGLGELGGFSELRKSVPDSYWHLFRPADDPYYPWPAIVLGYPVMAIWYWCTNQTIVQRSLAAKNIYHGQLGVVFTSYLKLLVPVIFFLPGLICKALHPNLSDADEAFMTMVGNYLPHGVIGLIVSVLIAALISTVNSMLNSGSAIFTIDIYQRYMKQGLSKKQETSVGRWSTLIGTVLSVLVAFGLSNVKGMNLFDLINTIFSFLSPSLAVIFLFGVFVKKTSSKAAFYTLIFGNIPGLVIGIMYLAQYPTRDFWPHFLLMAFYLFIALSVLISVLSFLFPDRGRTEYDIFKIVENQEKGNPKLIWVLWGVLASIMVTLYLIFF